MKMERTLTGNRPAAKAWAKWIADDLVAHCGRERCDAIPTFLKKPSAQLALEVHMDDSHGCGTWGDCVAFLGKLSEHGLQQWEGPHGVAAKYRFLRRERIRERELVVVRPGEWHINSLPCSCH